MSSQRIQRKRSKGWRKPEGAVFVGRPSRFGNPFPVCEVFPTPEIAVRVYREVIESGEGCTTSDEGTRWEQRNRFKRPHNQPDLTPEAIRAALRGKDLMCWCPLDQPCHADVLLELANDDRTASATASAKIAPSIALAAPPEGNGTRT